MFRKSTNAVVPTAKKTSNALVRKGVPSVISADMSILGNVVSEGTVDFDGTLDGNIRCHSLLVRHNGKVNGEIHAEIVQIYGRVKGLIKSKAVQLYASCTVEGIIMHENIAIEDGAMIDGKFKRTNKAPSPMSGDEEISDELGEPAAGKALENLRLIAG